MSDLGERIREVEGETLEKVERETNAQVMLRSLRSQIVSARAQLDAMEAVVSLLIARTDPPPEIEKPKGTVIETLGGTTTVIED